jgi:hypothetical protein
VLHTVESNEDEPHGLRRGAGLTRGDLFPVVLALALFGLICAGLLIAFGVPRDPAAAGQFGDAFGSLSALFNGLAFAALYIALMLQGKQLFLQRRELSLQREELALTRGELKARALSSARCRCSPESSPPFTIQGTSIPACKASGRSTTSVRRYALATTNS